MSGKYRFSGGTSFMSNGYVIWQQGLSKDDPNWLAVQQGKTYAERMFYDRSLDQRSSFYEFTQFLLKIQQKEANKERNYINLKLEQMKSNIFQSSRVSAVQNALNDNNFGAAYTLLLSLDKSIEELKEEFSKTHFNNKSHMNKFWKAQFSSYFEKALANRVEIQGETLVKKIGDSPLTIDELVDNWMREMLTGADGVIAKSLEPIRNAMKSELLGYLQKHGIEGVKTYADDIFGKNSNFTQLSGFKTNRKRGGHRSAQRMVALIAEKIGNAVGKGLSQELQTTAEQGKSGAVVFNTGTFYKYITNDLKKSGYDKVYQKGDVTSFEVFSATYDPQKIANEIFSRNGYNQEAYNSFVQSLDEAAKNDSSQIFQVTTNVKGYRSKRDLVIEGVGNFKNRTKNLAKMATEAEGIPAFSMQKLIFMLNNTVEGCIAEDETDNLVNYIAAVCAAWMWDDYTDLFSLSENGSNIQKIRMFNSGGMYYSASQIIGKTVEELLSSYKGSSFVVVDIQLPVFDADTMYENLKSHYPVPQNNDKAVWQSALAPRWNEMRDYVSTHGTISIKFNQAGLEKLLGNLQTYL